MPATGIKVTYFFQDDQFGISESHDLDSNGSLDSAKVLAIKLLKLRMKLMGFGVEVVGVRLSREGVFRDSAVLDADDFAGITPPAFNYSGPNGNAGSNDPDQAKACVLVRAESGELHRKPIYLAGIPDIIIREDPRGPAVVQVPQWNLDFKNWKNALIADPWGFIGRAPAVGAATQYPISGRLTQGGTGLYGIVMSNALVTFNDLANIQIRGATRTHPAFKSINGRWQIGSQTAGPNTGQTTYWLLNSEGVAIDTVINNGKVIIVDFTFLKYSNVQLLGQTTRKRGNRFLAPPGRRRILKPLPG